LGPETDEMFQFLSPDTDPLCQLLEPDIFLTHIYDFWAQKRTEYVSFWAQKSLKWVGKVSGPRN
jgi:hypothetical protein